MSLWRAFQLPLILAAILLTHNRNIAKSDLVGSSRKNLALKGRLESKTLANYVASNAHQGILPVGNGVAVATAKNVDQGFALKSCIVF